MPLAQDNSNVLTLGGQTYRATTKNIEDITDKDIVLAKNPDTGELAAKAVVQSFRRVSDHLRVLRIRSADGTEQTIETTNEHPFWVPGSGWVEAGKVAIGDTVTCSDGRTAELVASNYEPHPEGVPVYNFEVADLHTYFVAASPRAPPVLVHNNCENYVYQLVNGSGEVIYYGITNNPSKRLARHAAEKAGVAGMEILGEGFSVAEARAIESALIRRGIRDGPPLLNRQIPAVRPIYGLLEMLRMPEYTILP